MSRHYGWVIVGAGAVISCVAAGSMFALPVYLAPMAEQTGWSRAGISAAMTLGFLVMGVAGFFWGSLSDRIGARKVVLLASVLLGLGLVLASQASSLVMFQLSYGVLIGAAAGAFFAPLMANVIGWFDTHRSLAVSLVSIGGGVAPMVVTPLATVLIENHGWRSAMLMVAVGAVAIIVPVALLLRPAPAPAGDAAMVGGSEAVAASQPGRIGAIMRTPQFIVLAGTFFLCCAAHSGPIFHTVSYAMICGASALAAANIYSVEGVAGLFGRLLFGLSADRFGVKRVIIGGLLLQSAGVIAYFYATQLRDFYLLAVVLGMAYGGVMPLYAVLARDYFPPQVMGAVLGGITMTSAIGMAFGPLGGGWIFDSFGDYQWLYISSAAIGLAAAALALAFPPPAPALKGAPLPA